MPDIFLGEEAHMPGQTITVFLVKQARLDIPDPTLTGQGGFTASCVVTGHLLADLRGRVEFWFRYHF